MPGISWHLLFIQWQFIATAPHCIDRSAYYFPSTFFSRYFWGLLPYYFFFKPEPVFHLIGNTVWTIMSSRRKTKSCFLKEDCKTQIFLVFMEMGKDRFLNHQEVRGGFTNHYSLPWKTHISSFLEEKSRTWRNTSYQWFSRLVNCTIHILVRKQITRSEYNM